MIHLLHQHFLGNSNFFICLLYNMFTYNRFQPILTGGTSNIVTTNISTIENVSLNVTGGTIQMDNYMF